MYVTVPVARRSRPDGTMVSACGPIHPARAPNGVQGGGLTRLVGLPGVAGAAGAALGVAAQGQREPMREQALDFCRQLGDRERGAVVLHNLAKATRFQGRFGVARERYEYVESVRSVYVSNSWHAQSR